MPRISKADACTLIQRYRDTGGWANGQTKSIWFSKDDLADILNMTTDFDADGMHIYLARYSQAPTPGAPDPAKYVNRVTVVLVPTVNGQDIFDVESPASGAGRASAMSGSGDPAYDHGTLQP